MKLDGIHWGIQDLVSHPHAKSTALGGGGVLLWTTENQSAQIYWSPKCLNRPSELLKPKVLNQICQRFHWVGGGGILWNYWNPKYPNLPTFHSRAGGRGEGIWTTENPKCPNLCIGGTLNYWNPKWLNATNFSFHCLGEKGIWTTETT